MHLEKKPWLHYSCLREDLDDYQRKRFYEPQEINKSSSLLLLDSIIIIQSWSKRRLLIRIFERKEGENLYIYFFACPWTPYFISLFIWGSLSTVEHPQKTTSNQGFLGSLLKPKSYKLFGQCATKSILQESFLSA